MLLDTVTIYANDYGDLLELMDPFHFVDRKEKVLIECVADLEITVIYPCGLEKKGKTAELVFRVSIKNRWIKSASAK